MPNPAGRSRSQQDQGVVNSRFGRVCCAWHAVLVSTGTSGRRVEVAKLKVGRQRAGEGGLSGPLFPRVTFLALAPPCVAYRISLLPHPLVVGVPAIITRVQLLPGQSGSLDSPLPSRCMCSALSGCSAHLHLIAPDFKPH